MGRLGGESERGTERKKGLKRREEVLGVLLTSAPLVCKCFPTPCAGKKLVGGNEERGKSGALAVFLCRDYSLRSSLPATHPHVSLSTQQKLRTIPCRVSRSNAFFQGLERIKLIACQRRTTLHRSSSIFHVWQYVANFKKSKE